MIYSMTAFARAQIQGDWGSLVCEMRSINHRYLEISFYLPEVLRVLEMPMRDRIRQSIKRGKIECVMRYQVSPESQERSFAINTDLARAYCRASEKMAAFLLNPAPISPSDILHYPGVLETKAADLPILQQVVVELLDKVLHDLLAAREREGEELKQLFLQRIDLMEQELNTVRERLPQVLKDQHDRLLKRLADVKLDLDPLRLEQEMVMFAQKIDVAEEIERTETHLAEVRRVLQQGGMAGRRLDFLLQELNREANTLGSKSIDSVITHTAVEMKVLIEQIREQVQNIE